MYNALILIVSLFVLIISYKLFEAAAGSLSPSKLNTISYAFYVQIVIMTFVGSILVACHMVDWHYLVERVSDKTKILAWVGVCYSMILMPLAMIAMNNIFGVHPKREFRNYLEAPVHFKQGPVLSMALLFFFTGVSFFVLVYTIKNSGSVPLLTLLSGNKADAARERVEVRYGFEGSQYIRNLFGYLMMPVVTYFAAVYAIEKRKLIYRLLFLVNFLMTIFLLAFDTQKAPIAFFIFGFLILWTLLRGGISRKRIIIMGAIGLVLVAGGYSLTKGVSMIGQITDIGSSLWGRVFITEYAGYLLSLEFFPTEIKDPTWFIGLPESIVKMMGYNNVESARLLMMHVNPEGVASGEANLISSYYMAEAWANYGWVGLLLSPVVVGVVVQSVHIFLLKHSKQPLIIAFYTAITVRWLLSSGFVNFLYLKIILYPLVFYYLYSFLMKLLANKKQPVTAQS